MVASAATRVSWAPLVVIALAQVLLAFNITALKISIDAISSSFNASASVMKSAIIIYSLVVAGCILVGAKIGAVFGARRVFRAAVALFGAAMLAMVLSSQAATMIVAQVAAGAAAAMLVPTSVALVAENYSAAQQATALGWLGGVRSMSLAPAFLVAGAVTTWSDWRVTFVFLLLLAASIYVLSYGIGERPGPTRGRSELLIDKAGFALIMLALLLIGLGCENLIDWGVLRARPQAPFSVLSFSPAPLVIACGVLLVKLFMVRSRRRRIEGREPLFAPEVIDAPRERSVLFAIFAISAVSSAVTFMIPLYMEIVQGRSSLHTAMAMMPLTLCGFLAAILVMRLRGRVRARHVARYAFLAVAAGLALLGVTIRNDWGDSTVILGMMAVGLGDGALVTLLFKALISTTRAQLVTDVEPLCDATSYFATAVGTALAGALVVGVLAANVQRELTLNPAIAAELRAHLNLDRVAFVSNDHLRGVLEAAAITPQQVSEAVHINTQARLRALKISFYTLAGLALLGVISTARSQREAGRGPRSNRSSRRSARQCKLA